MRIQNQEHVDRLLTLDGPWEVGEDRCYDRVVNVPGLAADPCQPTQGLLWYRREVVLPAGTWSHATLLLYGARFCPQVYVDGQLVAARAGGMTVTMHDISCEAVRPDKTIVLEIALLSLHDVAATDASFIPIADHWRTNLSSGLWDHVTLRLHAAYRMSRVIPAFDIVSDTLTVTCYLEQLPEDIIMPMSLPSASTPRSDNPLRLSSVQGDEPPPSTPRSDKPVRLSPSLICQIVNNAGDVLIEGQGAVTDLRGSVTLALQGVCALWSPEQPHCYRLRVMLRQGEVELDRDEMTLGLKDFRTRERDFVLNNAPVHMRAGTVVWQRWLRDPEAHDLAFDVAWFERNVVVRLKQYGANGLRFHLGIPPEALLDLCDRHGLLVQIEWHFFHGMTASAESLREQWRNWLNVCMRHPCICLIHAWNETEGAQLTTALAVLEELATDYPPLVISHRDVLHIHKYWWSLFENLGLYYDTASEFPLPIMVDEFGGNYLDGAGNPGGYPALAESFLRFLGRDHDAALRLQLHCEANTQIAEYWRRVGAAGFSPFCILGSPEDGNHHFLGPLREAVPKPVWAGLTAAYAPQSCSLEVWDRNYVPGQLVQLPVYFFNETGRDALLKAQVRIVSEDAIEHVASAQMVEQFVQAYAVVKRIVTLQLPVAVGQWRFQAMLQNSVESVAYPIVSSWRLRIFSPQVPQAVQQALFGIPEDERELRAFCAEQGLYTCAFDDPRADVLVTAALTWREFTRGNQCRAHIEQALQRGQAVLMLDIGPRKLGYGYVPGKHGFLQGGISVKEPDMQEFDLVHGMRVRFHEIAEPESCLHPAETNHALWANLTKQHCWLWNGLRGGLIVPASAMTLPALDAASFVTLWQSLGADGALIRAEADYCAYELAGFYAFSVGEDAQVVQQLRAKVMLLVEDAPALQAAIDTQAPIRTHRLSALYRNRLQQSKRSVSLTALATCGKNLTRIPIVQIDFGPDRGQLLLSQVMTQGRLAQGFGEDGLYGVRYDAAAVQLTLNMLQQCLTRAIHAQTVDEPV